MLNTGGTPVPPVDLLTIDYGLNDLRVGLDAARAAWLQMSQFCADLDIPVVFLTPTWDDSYFTRNRDERWTQILAHTAQIRALADECGALLCDSFAAWERAVNSGTPLESLLSQSNHPNEAGHAIVAKELFKTIKN